MLSQNFVNATEAYRRSRVNRAADFSLTLLIKGVEEAIYGLVERAINNGDTSCSCRIFLDKDGEKFLCIFESYVAPEMRKLGYEIRRDTCAADTSAITISWKQ